MEELRVVGTEKRVKGTALTPSQLPKDKTELELVVVHQTMTKPHRGISSMLGEIFHLSHLLARSCDFTTTYKSISNFKSCSRNCIV